MKEVPRKKLLPPNLTPYGSQSQKNLCIGRILLILITFYPKSSHSSLCYQHRWKNISMIHNMNPNSLWIKEDGKKTRTVASNQFYENSRYDFVEIFAPDSQIYYAQIISLFSMTIEGGKRQLAFVRWMEDHPEDDHLGMKRLILSDGYQVLII